MDNFESLDHEQFIERACELAREAGERGDGPYGSVLVVDGEIIMEAANRENISQHAELTLARRASNELEPENVKRAIIYTSTEPCPMCATGITYTDLKGVVYAVSGERVSEIRGQSKGTIPCREVFDRLGASTSLYGPVSEQKGIAVHKEY